MTTELPRCRYTRRAPIGPLPYWLPIWRWPYLFQYVGTRGLTRRLAVLMQTECVAVACRCPSTHWADVSSVGYLSAVALRWPGALWGVGDAGDAECAAGRMACAIGRLADKSAFADVCVLCAGRNPTEVESS